MNLCLLSFHKKVGAGSGCNKPASRGTGRIAPLKKLQATLVAFQTCNFIKKYGILYRIKTTKHPPLDGKKLWLYNKYQKDGFPFARETVNCKIWCFEINRFSLYLRAVIFLRLHLYNILITQMITRQRVKTSFEPNTVTSLES